MNGLLALAFAAGMLAPVNPCGFALLPAWITYSLGDTGTAPLPVRLTRALRAGAVLTIGFAGTLAGTGLIISAGARALIHYAPWLGLATGIALLILGLVMLTGRSLRLRLPILSMGTGRDAAPGVARLAVFGIGYAGASLSCTVGVLLAVIAQAQATSGYAGLLAVFGAYAAGAAAVLLLVSVSTAAAGAALTRRLTGLARYAGRVTAAILVLTGGYLTWYWYPAAVHGNSANSANSTNSSGLAGFSATASTWIGDHTTLIAVLAIAVVLTVTATATGYHVRGTRSRPHTESDCCTTEHTTTPEPTPTTGIDPGTHT